MYRDQSKSKKLKEVWARLPDLKTHFDNLSRSEQTEFINNSVVREKGRLQVQEATMMKLLTKREETQAGREKMKGYALEELLNSGPQPIVKAPDPPQPWKNETLDPPPPTTQWETHTYRGPTKPNMEQKTINTPFHVLALRRQSSRQEAHNSNLMLQLEEAESSKPR